MKHSTHGTATEPTVVSHVEDEFAGVDLGDERLDRRLLAIANAVARSPNQGFPKALPTEAELEGFYRFMSNPRVDPQAVLAPHLAASAVRAAQFDEVLALHDTTQFDYETQREGLGRVAGGKTNGYMLHACLVVEGPERRVPLGLGTVLPWVRQGERRGTTESGRRLSGREYAKVTDKESRRWFDCVDRVEKRIAEHGSTQVIHVADREADSYELLSTFLEAGSRFVVRTSRDRVVQETDTDDAGDEALAHLREVVERAETVCERDVHLSRRKGRSAPRAAKANPKRDARTARLAFAACQVQVRRPVSRPDLLDSIAYNVVHVREVDPPSGEEPVEWLLATTEPIGTVEQILRIVDIYRARWLIEEFFKALKTGCALEQRQLASYEGLLRAFALFAPIAWQMLRLRAHSRDEITCAGEVLTSSQLAVLRHIARKPLPPEPTAKEALWAIARLGGHLRSNGDPGWLTLSRGMMDLARAHAGWVACAASMAGLGEM